MGYGTQSTNFYQETEISTLEADSQHCKILVISILTHEKAG